MLHKHVYRYYLWNNSARVKSKKIQLTIEEKTRIYEAEGTDMLESNISNSFQSCTLSTMHLQFCTLVPDCRTYVITVNDVKILYFQMVVRTNLFIIKNVYELPNRPWCLRINMQFCNPRDYRWGTITSEPISSKKIKLFVIATGSKRKSQDSVAWQKSSQPFRSETNI